MNILQINASARREGANSTRIADAVVERLRAENPTARVQVRDLASQPHPILDETALAHSRRRPSSARPSRPPASRSTMP
jgi:FMN-dependent NADH-azoreductase